MAGAVCPPEGISLRALEVSAGGMARGRLVGLAVGEQRSTGPAAPADLPRVTLNLMVGLVSLVFNTAAFAFFLYSWWVRDRELSLIAFTYSCIFAAGGVILLVVWRLAGD